VCLTHEVNDERFSDFKVLDVTLANRLYGLNLGRSSAKHYLGLLSDGNEGAAPIGIGLHCDNSGFNSGRRFTWDKKTSVAGAQIDRKILREPAYDG
jgi:hypothetical protein